MKIKVWTVIVVILGLIGFSVGTYLTVQAIRTPLVVEEVNEKEVSMTPTIDFVQGYYFIHEEGKEFDYATYFSDLRSLGYDTLIFQFTRSEVWVDYDNGIIGHEFYYPTTISEELCPNIVRDYDYILEEFMSACDQYDFDCYIGLSVEEISWWALTCYYDDAYMSHCRDTDRYMIEELSDIVRNHESFIGWYYAFELFSNPVGWEKLWAENIKDFVSAVEENYDAPIMLSPFRQIQLGLITNEYAMWNSFFKRSGLREKDIFTPQDSIGKLDSTGDPTTGEGHKEITKENLRRVYDYTNACAKACEKYGIHYYINCELFRAVNGDSMYLFVSDADRALWQIKNASRVAEKLVTFSASHYLLNDSNACVDTEEARALFLSEYKELLNK